MTPQFTANQHSKGWGPILTALRAHGRPMTRLELAKALGKSPSYTQGYMPAMIAAGAVITQVDPNKATMGRAPHVYGLPEWGRQ